MSGGAFRPKKSETFSQEATPEIENVLDGEAYRMTATREPHKEHGMVSQKKKPQLLNALWRSDQRTSIKHV